MFCVSLTAGTASFYHPAICNTQQRRMTHQERVMRVLQKQGTRPECLYVMLSKKGAVLP